MIEERFFKVRITRVTCTDVQVPAVTSEQAIERAMGRVPASGAAWEIKRTKAEILNVSRVEEGMGDDQIDQQ